MSKPVNSFCLFVFTKVMMFQLEPGLCKVQDDSAGSVFFGSVLCQTEYSLLEMLPTNLVFS